MHETEVVYVIEHIKSGMTKIGITSDWFSRSATLKVHQETRLIGLFESCDMEKTEKDLHRFFRKQRLPGSEYFFLTKEQQKDLLDKARENNREMEDLTGTFRAMTNSPIADVTNAVLWSSRDWLRLNRKSWRRRISDYCSQPFEDTDLEVEADICKRQIQEIATEMNDPWCFGTAEQRAAEKICNEFFGHHKASIDKKNFHRTSYNTGKLRFYLKQNAYENIFEHLIFTPSIQDAEVVVKDIKLKAETLRFLLRMLIDYRGGKYCEQAINALADRREFGYYLSCLGPITSD